MGEVGEDGTGEGGWEGMESEDGGGDMGKGVGGMVLSMAFDTQFFLMVMVPEVMEFLGSTWVSSSSLMNWYSLSPDILHHIEEFWEIINTGGNY